MNADDAGKIVERKRLAPHRTAGETTKGPIWNRAMRRAFKNYSAREQTARVRRTADRIRKRKAARGYERAHVLKRGLPKKIEFDWGAVVRASERKAKGA